jgi:circadian clock protein KaiC
MNNHSSARLCHTGNVGLDNILGGGLPPHRLYLVEGDPGVGKTTLGLQFLLEGVRRKETVLYITLSETKDELEMVAKSHGWSLDGIHLFEFSALEQQMKMHEGSTFFHPSEVQLNETTQTFLKEVDRLNPSRVVFDSLSEMRLLSETPLRHRRQILSLKQYFAKRKSTVLMLDDRAHEGTDLHVQSLAHGVIFLQKLSPEYGVSRRRINVQKIRGQSFREGYHDYVIHKGCMEFFPRLIAGEHRAKFKQEALSSGIPELDALLGGGLDRGTSTVIMGAAGTGKTTISLQFALSAIRSGEKAALFLFDEGMGTLLARASGIGMDLEGALKSGQLFLQQVDPAELSPGEFVHTIRRKVEDEGVRLISIDSMNGYMNAMPAEKFLQLHLHELYTYLNQLGVVTLTILAQQGLIGQMQSQADLSYLADNVMLLRYYEVHGTVKQAISMIKKRSGAHERHIREFEITARGLRVGRPLKEFQGILTGTPLFSGRLSSSQIGEEASSST